MRTDKNILVAFLLNLLFAVFEFAGGVLTGSVAIISDAVHDCGDAVSIGISWFLERKSRKQPDEKYTYGYSRYSAIGGLMTTGILIFGSMAVIYNAVLRIINPTEINYNGMIIFAVVGVIVNLVAAYVTHNGDSINQKAVNLHLLEDVLGWVVVLVGSIIMRFTDLAILDPIMSIAVALFILISSVKNLIEVLELFLEKIPRGISVDEVKHRLCSIEGVEDVHHVHIRSMDGQKIYATMHIVTNANSGAIKEKVREKLTEMGIVHATLELETEQEHCVDRDCIVEATPSCHHHHHH